MTYARRRLKPATTSPFTTQKASTMCGIAGALDIAGHRVLPSATLNQMADAIEHRGPDEEGFWSGDGVSMASRRLSIVGLADGQQPMTNEDGSVVVVFNGELFDYQEKRRLLQSKGHRFRTQCDTEIIPHLWEEFGDAFLDHLEGQFAFALFDKRQRRLILARDHFGICPLYWAQRDDWLLFGSEIKAIFASGLISPHPDLRGVNHAFTYFAMPGPTTCFEDVTMLQPGHFLDISLEVGDRRPQVKNRVFWEMDFPDEGDERDAPDDAQFVREFEEVLLRAVEKRLRADVPVVSYLSGGVDSGIVVAMANYLRKRPIPAFTIGVQDKHLNETSEAMQTARHVGSTPTVVPFAGDALMAHYPELVAAGECPVIDTSCAGLLLLAKQVHADGYKAVLTGEGADEWLAGYPWNKLDRLLSYADIFPRVRISQWLRRTFLRLTGAPRLPDGVIQQVHQVTAGHNGWLDIYGLMGMSKLRFFNERMLDVMAEHPPYADLNMPTAKLKRWHPLNRSSYFAGRIHLPGLLLHAKGDRIAMHSSVETRYPFLDRDVFSFLANLHPRWKMRGLREKYILRRVAERWLPKSVAWRAKAMYRAPLDSFHCKNPPAFVDQLFSPDSLRKTNYFNVQAVQHWRKAFRTMRPRSSQRSSVELGLCGVLSTQLWHHLFIAPELCELPGLAHSNSPEKGVSAHGGFAGKVGRIVNLNASNMPA